MRSTWIRVRISAQVSFSQRCQIASIRLPSGGLTSPAGFALFADFAGEGEKGEKLRAALTAAIPFRRLGQPGDLPGIVVFLASDEASFITGQVISVSGGLTMAG